MFARTIVAAGFALFLASTTSADAQLASPSPDAVRVTVSLNADGTRTTYEFDAPRRRAVATTTTKEGKLVGKIRYVLDEAGRFYSGEVYGPDDQFRFKTLYKYDDAGKLTQETQLGPDEAVRNKIVYAYDKAGRQTGYSVYDAAGKLVRQTPGSPPRSPGAAPRSTPPNKRK
jgi:YD repeat-containing protein